MGFIRPILFVCILFYASLCGAANSFETPAKVEELSYLLDHHQQLTVPEVLAGHYDDAFVITQNPQQLDLKPSQAQVWLRIRLSQEHTDKDSFSVLSLRKYLLAELEAFAPIAPGDPIYTPLVLQEGALVHSPNIAGRYPVFKLPSYLDSSDYVYLRLWAPTLTLNIPFNINTYDEYQRQYRQQLLYSTSLYGVLVAMLLLALSMSLGSQRRYYIPFSLVLAGMLGSLLCISGDVVSIFPLAIFPYAIWLLFASLVVGSVGTWWFTRSFLQTKTMAPRLHLLLNILLVPPAVSGIILACGFYSLINYPPHASALLGGPVILLTAVYCLLKAYKPARFFILAWLCAMLGQLVFTLGTKGFIEYSILTDYAIFIGVALEAVLLNLAINDRYQVLDKEHQSLQEASLHYQALSVRDPLTNLFNKRHFLEWLDNEHQRDNQDSPLSVIMLDLDHFKAYNDRYGHPEGDKVLKALGATVADNLRHNDIACRYGGEEFAIILPDVHSQRAEMVAERIRKAFAKLSFAPTSIDTVGLTVSQGVATAKEGERPELLIQRADQALYTAKKQNRNQVVVSEKVNVARTC